MAIAIKMPALSPTMESGTLSKWLVKEGDSVSSGDVIAEIETDKATMEFEAVEEGILAKQLVPEGTADVGVGQPIALLAEEGEDPASVEVPTAEAAEGAAEKETETAAAAEKTEAAPPQAPKSPARAEAAAAAKPEEVPEKSASERIFASPLARRMARDAGIDLAALKGSGPRGRIIKSDIEEAKREGVPEAAPAAAEPRAAPAAAIAGVPDRPFEEVKLSTMRRTIARRLTEAKQNVPHFYLTVDIAIDNLLDMRRELNDRMDEGKLSVNDFLIRAVALALKKKPDVNVLYAGDKLYKMTHADISMAVAIDGGLITPIIKEAETKGLKQISEEAKDLTERARTGKLAPEEFQGGSFSISNLGMYGIKHFDAVINPPQAAILAVGAGEKRPVVKDDEIVTATMMTVTMSCDHRAVDGALGAEFLEVFKGLVEDPLSLLL